MRLLLKTDRPGAVNEALFYRELAGRLPIATPHVLDARLLREERGWILMEELPDAKPGSQWTPHDTHGVVCDMARLHAVHWDDPQLAAEADWLWRPSPNALADRIDALHSHLSAIAAAGLADVLPDVLDTRRIRLIGTVLDRAETVLEPLLAAGTTFVHGDYWFHNVRLLPDGRRVLIDWQSCSMFSGIWELVYFLDLWHVVRKRSFRARLPESEAQVVSWYAHELRENGIVIPDADFRETLLCARLWQPLAHWLPRLGHVARSAQERRGWRVARRARPVARAVAAALASRGGLRHLALTWDRWEEIALARVAAGRSQAL